MSSTSSRRSRAAAAGLALGLAGAGVLAPASAARAAELELHARMTPTSYCPNAHGGAQYESHSGWRELEVHVWGLQRLAGKRVTVRAHGTLVGRMRVSRYGAAHLDRHRGVPAMAAGDRVRVTWSGHLASSGRLRGIHHHDAALRP